MKIALLRRKDITALDGVNRFIFNLADGLNTLNHNIHIISYSSQPNGYPNLKSFAENFFDSEGNIKIHTLAKTSRTKGSAKIASTWLCRGSQLLDKLNVDAVILNGIVPLKTKATKIAVNHGMFHAGNSASAKGLMQQVYAQTAKYLYRNFTDIQVCVASRLAEELQQFMKIHFTIIPLPLKLHLFKTEPLEHRDSMIIHIGTREEKNVELSIQAVKILAKQMNIQEKLVIVGSKNTNIEHLMLKYRNLIPEHLEFMLPPVSSSKALRNLLSHSKALLLPSKYEAFSYAVLEAFASGLPAVVSYAVPSELVQDGYNGFRINSLDPAKYATVLATLFKDDTRWCNTSANALKTANNYSHLKIAKTYESMIEKFAESKQNKH